MSDHRSIPITRQELDRLAPLWEGMRRHYEDLAGDRLPLRTAEESWRRRRATYEQLLAEPGAFIRAAERDGELLGYVAVRPVATSPAFGFSERAGDVETLVVAEGARGSGIGARLLADARRRLAEEGIGEVVLHVLAGNDRAIDFYRREGFATYQIMMSDAMPHPLLDAEAAGRC